MNARDTLIAETTSALVIVGLLLVFLPMFLDAIRRARGGNEPWKKLRLLKLRPWVVAIAVGIGAADATAGLLTLWGTYGLAKLTAVLLLVLVWAVVGVAVLASAYGR
jgi:hypothetical protein